MKPEDIVSHYEDSGSCNVAWLREMIRQETEGEIPNDAAWHQLQNEQREAEENGNQPVNR